MSKILKPARLIRVLVCVLVLVSVCHFFSCHPAGGGEEDHINPDSVRNHIMSYQTAIQYTANFRAAIDTVNKRYPAFKDSMQFGRAEAFPKDVFLELLRQKNDSQGMAMGIRIYYGRDNEGKIHQILVPYDSNGNDIINHIIDINGKPASGVHVEALTVSDGQVLQNGQRCPTQCSSDSLN